MHIRRYCLLQAFEARLRDQDALWYALRGKQQETPGTPLPVSIAGYALLVAAGYTCVEDILTPGALAKMTAADRVLATAALASELIRNAGLNLREANAAIAAIG